MKIGLVLPNLPAYSETFFKNKILGLQEHGHEVVLFVNQKPPQSDYLNCKIFHAPNLSGNKLVVMIISFLQVLQAIIINPRKSFKLYQLNKKDGLSFKTNFKQILANQFLLNEPLEWLHFGFGTMTLGRENVAAVIGAQMAVSFRGFDHYIYPDKNPNCYKQLFSKNVRYHVLSEGMRKGLIQQNISPLSIHKITPALDASLFKADSIEKNKLVVNKVIQITTIARLHWIKGLEYTLQALSLLQKQGIDFHYTIIGDGPERERLVFATHQMGLEKRVTFAGTLTPIEVKKSLEQADVYLQYSIQEGFCNAVLEAQAMGLLCVVSDAEGLTENVRDTETGWVVPKRNPQLLATKIEEVLNLTESEKNKITNQAVERINTIFTMEHQMQQFVAFYQW